MEVVFAPIEVFFFTGRVFASMEVCLLPRFLGSGWLVSCWKCAAAGAAAGLSAHRGSITSATHPKKGAGCCSVQPSDGYVPWRGGVPVLPTQLGAALPAPEATSKREVRPEIIHCLSYYGAS